MSRRPTVGDRVRMVSSYAGGWSGLKAGDIRTVIEADGRDYRPLNVGTAMGAAFGRAWVDFDDVELIEEKETKMTELEKMHRDYEAMGKTLKEMEEKAKRPNPAKGQVWRNIRAGNLYLVSSLTGTDLRLIRVNGAESDFGGVYRDDGFDGNEHAFEYIGMAKDILSINLPK